MLHFINTWDIACSAGVFWVGETLFVFALLKPPSLILWQWKIGESRNSNFYVRTCVKFTFANKIEAMYEGSHVSVKVETRSTSRLAQHLISCLYFYLFTWFKFTFVKYVCITRMCLYGHLCTRLSRTLLAALHVHRIEIPYRAFPERVGPRILLLERVDYFGTSDYFSGRKNNNLNEQNF